MDGAPHWDQPVVECPCCHGAGAHEVRPFLSISPYDYEAPCEYCFGDGQLPAGRAHKFQRGYGCKGHP